MKRLLLIVVVVFASLFTGCKDDFENEIRVVTPEEMKSLMELEDVQLIDVRSEQERQEGFIKNSQNIDFNSPTFDEDIQKLDKSKPVILYCRSGARSASCVKKLQDAGFVKIYDLQGGITQWRFEGYDLELPK